MKSNFLKKFIICLFLLVFFLPSFVLAEDTEILNLESPAAILIDGKSGKVLFEKNADQKMYPASLTKILTAIIVIENCDLNATTTVSNSAVMSVPFRIRYSKFTIW